MHEALHAYLEATGKPGELQHEEMALKYVTEMANVLRQMYPNLNDAEAKNLSLNGLDLTTTFEDTIANHLELDAQWRSTNLAYSIGAKGKRCQ